MKHLFIFFISFVVLITSCQDKAEEPQHNLPDSMSVYNDHERPDTVDVFTNERFQNVLVRKTDDSTFEVTGKAQVFEAAFSWVVEDGHRELKQGHQMTDAGAPSWGNFSFQLTAAKKDPNTVLHLILFESSAKDGSRQHELPIPLY